MCDFVLWLSVYEVRCLWSCAPANDSPRVSVFSVVAPLQPVDMSNAFTRWQRYELMKWWIIKSIWLPGCNLEVQMRSHAILYVTRCKPLISAETSIDRHSKAWTVKSFFSIYVRTSGAISGASLTCVIQKQINEIRKTHGKLWLRLSHSMWTRARAGVSVSFSSVILHSKKLVQEPIQ